MKKFVFFTSLILISIVLVLCLKNSKIILPKTYYQVYLDGELLGTIKSKEKLEEYINEQGNLIKEQVLDYQNKIKIIDETANLLLKNYDEQILNDINNLNYYKGIYDSLIKLVNEEGNFLVSYDEVYSLINSLDEKEYDYELTSEKIKNYDNLLSSLDLKIKELSIKVFKNIDVKSLNESESYYLEEYLKNEYYNILYSKYLYMKDYYDEYEIYAHVENVYKPLGINIKKINTYKDNVITEKEAYEKIILLKPCTVEGYQFRIKRQDNRTIDSNSMFASLGNTNYNKIKKTVSNDIIIYVTDKEIFTEAMDTYVGVFVGTDVYENYKNGTQPDITTTGTIIEDIYVDQEITIKQTNISVKEKIYTNAQDLSSYLLYGDNVSITTAYATSQDTISTFVYNNKISVEEFFLFNREFTSINNMFYDGQPIVIAKLNPQVNLVVEEYSVVDKETNYNTVERYNSSLSLGSKVVVQQGQNGIERVSQNVKKVNGTITYVEPISKETIVGSTSEIIDIGTKIIPHVGSTGSWGWPTNPGYTLTSYYGYRLAVFGEGDFHSGIDIAGTGVGSPVYAANNGTIITKTYTYSYGNYIMIDHNNGFYTLYAHMNGFDPNVSVGSVVSRGQTIGYVGSTGWSTGPHLHFEIRVCERYSCTVDPLRYY